MRLNTTNFFRYWEDPNRVRPLVYLVGAASYVVKLPVRACLVAYRLYVMVKSLLVALGSLLSGDRTKHWKALGRDITLLGSATAEVLIAAFGVLFPIAAARADEWLYSHDLIEKNANLFTVVQYPPGRNTMRSTQPIVPKRMGSPEKGKGYCRPTLLGEEPPRLSASEIQDTIFNRRNRRDSFVYDSARRALDKCRGREHIINDINDIYRAMLFQYLIDSNARNPTELHGKPSLHLNRAVFGLRALFLQNNQSNEEPNEILTKSMNSVVQTLIRNDEIPNEWKTVLREQGLILEER